MKNSLCFLRALSWRPLLLLFLLGCSPVTDNAPADPPSAAGPSPQRSEVAVIPATEKPATEKPAAEKPAAEKPATTSIAEDPPLDPNVDVDGLLASRLTAEELELGWIRLFDGQSLMGWRDAGNADWRVENGEIVATSGEPGLLVTQVRFGDYELELEYMAEEKTNSGVFLRTPDQPTDPENDCYELNIAPPDNPFPTGSLVGRSKVSEQIDAPEPDQWHTMHALVDQSHVQAWIDGEQTIDYQDATGLTAGKIGLQFRDGSVRFRNIRLRPIGYRVLPGGKASDWNEPQGSIQSRFTEDGSLVIEGGRGHMELLQPHADVCIQASALTRSENTNSGIFFRCIPGEDMNGYECQIHHGYREDRRRPLDAGSGAIFRRQNAKAVLSDEGRPVHVTIVADGPHIATWVDGVQVVQWEDTRPPNPNPRKGLRTEAGTIMLQGHDPGTQIEFLSLSISPLP